MIFSFDLLINAVISGILIGAFYAAVTAGITISFGILDIVNIAHPAFIILGSYIAYIVNATFGLDPIITAIIVSPAFYALGAAIYQIYYVSFEKRGQESMRGLAFFFGLLFITEVTLVLYFGVDYRYVEARYIGPTLHFGYLDIPLRILVPCLVSLLMIAVLQLFLTRTFIGRAIMAVAQDQLALKLLAVDPIRSSGSPSAFPSPALRLPARSSSSSSRSSRRSDANISAASSPSACWAAWAACRERLLPRCWSALSKA